MLESTHRAVDLKMWITNIMIQSKYQKTSHFSAQCKKSSNNSSFNTSERISFQASTSDRDSIWVKDVDTAARCNTWINAVCWISGSGSTLRVKPQWRGTSESRNQSRRNKELQRLETCLLHNLIQPGHMVQGDRQTDGISRGIHLVEVGRDILGWTTLWLIGTDSCFWQ